MDVLTLAQAKKYARALVEAMGGDVDALEKAIDDIENDISGIEGDVVVVDADGDLASTLILNRLRQHIWQNEDDALICETGTVTLTNTQTFPFNNSQKSVALANTQKNTKYVVIPEDVTEGNIGEIVITDKQVNGFKIAFTGSAASATVKYTVIGGFIK